jgi:hypothetical protein
MLAAIAAACGGARANAAPPSEPLVIPPMGSAGASAIPLPPPAPPAPHVPTDEECNQILTRIVELTLDQAGMKDPKQREEMIKQFIGGPLGSSSMRQTCENLRVDDEAMHCLSTATELSGVHACLKQSEDASGSEDR